MTNYKKTKETIETFLNDKKYENKALALSGEWGVGKTHLINSIKKERILKIENCIKKTRNKF